MGMGGGVGLLVVAVICVFYAENYLLRIFVAGLVIIMLGVSAYVAFLISGSPGDFYWTLGVTCFAVIVAAMSKLKPYRGSRRGRE